MEKSRPMDSDILVKLIDKLPPNARDQVINLILRGIAGLDGSSARSSRQAGTTNGKVRRGRKPAA